MSEDMIDVLDENGVKTGEIVTRSEVHRRGLWHRAIVVAIINEKNQILIQKRSATKAKNPNKWDISAAGHISTGQDSLMAATREINEEVSVNLGFNVEVKEFRFMYSFRKQEVFDNGIIENQFYDFFVLRQNGLNENSIRYQESEVQAVKFVNITELNEIRKTEDFVERPEIYDVLSDFLFRF